MRWDEAHRIAVTEALHARRRLQMSTVGPVDVFGAIENAGIVLAFEPMPRLSGAYVAETGCPTGIVVNSNHPLSRQRFTAAHELGHWYLHHGTRVDPDAGSYAERGPSSRASDEEKLAEAFASWFLMPRKLVVATLREMALNRPERPEDLYGLALRLGVSYESAAWHMLNLKFATRPTVLRWLKTRPAQIKRSLGGPFSPDNARNDVWSIGPLDVRQPLLVRPGDRLLVEVTEIASSGRVWAALPDDSASVVGEDYLGAIQFSPDGEPIVGNASTHVFVLDIENAERRRDGVLRIYETAPWATNIPIAQMDREDKTTDVLNYDLVVEPPRRGVSERFFQGGS